jgi:outer membrane PBP1 activator LpoA protein
MTMSNSRVPSPARVPRRGGRLAAVPALFLALALASCATLLPGEDAIVVRTEQTLEASLAVYDAGMTWCRANPAHLTPEAAKIAEAIRTGFPPAYRSLDSALQLYKAGKRKDLLSETDELRRLVEQLLFLVRLSGGPDLTGGKP